MIPVFVPNIGEEEIAAVADAIRRGEISGSFGESIPRFEEAFADYCGCKFGVAVSSGTAALHLAVAALELKPGDEILVSASTNIASALAAYHNNLVPIPVDSEPRTWNLNLELIEKLKAEKGYEVDVFSPNGGECEPDGMSGGKARDLPGRLEHRPQHPG